MENKDVHKIVREGYAKVATLNTSCCGDSKSAANPIGCGCGSNGLF
jgi:hypothetical protein